MTLQSELSRLENAELIRRMYGEDLAYLIKHALVQETARGSLLLHERKRLNSLVAEAVEQLYPNDGEQNTILLAQYLEEAGEDARSYEYWMQAADRDLRQQTLLEARVHLEHALATAERANLSPREVYLKRGRLAELDTDFARALEIYAEMYARGEREGDGAMQLAALLAQTTILSIPSTIYAPKRAQELSDQALALARTLNDPAAEATIYWNLLLLNSRVGAAYLTALDFGEQGLEIAEQYGLSERRNYLLNDMAMMLTYVGQPERALRFNLEARENWRAWNNLPMLADNINYSVQIHLAAGRYNEALVASAEGYRINHEIGNQWGQAFSISVAGQAHWEHSDIAQAIETMEYALTFGKVFPPVTVLTRSDLARLYGDLGAVAYALKLATAAFERASGLFPGLSWWPQGVVAHLHLLAGDIKRAARVLADTPYSMVYGYNPRFVIDRLLARFELGLAQGESAQVVAAATELLAFLEAGGLKQFLPTVRLFRALGWALQKEWEPARADLRAAQDVAEEMGAVWRLWQIHASAFAVETQAGDAVAAEQQRARARELIESIAARIPAGISPHTGTDLRASFLATPAVRAIVEGNGVLLPHVAAKPKRTASARTVKPATAKRKTGNGKLPAKKTAPSSKTKGKRLAKQPRSAGKRKGKP